MRPMSGATASAGGPGAAAAERPSSKRPHASTEAGSASDDGPGSSDAASSTGGDAASAATATDTGTDPSDVRIGMWQRSTKRKLAGKLAPTKSELAKFLAEHTDCEVYTGQDVVGLTNGSAGRVAVWHKQKRLKVTGEDAPEAAHLLEWLNQHPEYEVFCGQLSKTQRKGQGKAQAKATSQKVPAPDDERVEIWNRKLERRLSGNVAPYRRNLDQYLRSHPDCEVYTGQQPSANESATSASASSELGDADSSEDEPDDADLSPQHRRVTLWNTITKKKVTGSNAPMAKNLSACLKRHPDYQVYTGQDGKTQRNSGIVRPKHGPAKPVPGLKMFARMGTFDFAGNDMLVVRTEDSENPVPYYLGALHKSHKAKAKRDRVPIQWILPEFVNKSRQNPRTCKKIATQWESGCSVLMRFDDSCWYHGICSDCDLSKRTCTIDFDDGDQQNDVSFDDNDVLLISEHPFRQPMSLKEVEDRSAWRADGYSYKISQDAKPDFVSCARAEHGGWCAN